MNIMLTTFFMVRSKHQNTTIVRIRNLKQQIGNELIFNVGCVELESDVSIDFEGNIIPMVMYSNRLLHISLMNERKENRPVSRKYE